VRIRGKEKVPGLLAAANHLMHEASAGMLPIPPHTTANYLEIGCGRGAFITEYAMRRPDAFFVGIDKYTPIVARSAALAMDKGLTNIRILDLDIEYAQGILPERSFSGIYINFSDPWPRRRNDIKRLTHPRLLGVIAKLLTPEGTLEQKTDNAEFFAWSVDMLQRANFTLLSVTHRLPAHAPADEMNLPRYIQTEYEQRFRALDIPIHHLVAKPPAALDS